MSVPCSKPTHGPHLNWVHINSGWWSVLPYPVTSSHSYPCSCHPSHTDLLLFLNWAKFVLAVLCTWCPFCMEYSSPRNPHDLFLYFIWVCSLNISLSPKPSLSTTTQNSLIPRPHFCPTMPCYVFICLLSAPWWRESVCSFNAMVPKQGLV